MASEVKELGQLAFLRFLHAKREEMTNVLTELEARSVAGEEDWREHGEAFGIREYLYLDVFDKRVMASLISKAELVGEDRLEVEWKYRDVYEKIFADVAE